MKSRWTDGWSRSALCWRHSRVYSSGVCRPGRFRRWIRKWRFLIRGQETPSGVPIPSAEYRVVSGDLFSALRIPIRLGRGFHEHDLPDSLPVAIVNETMARRYWPGENPIGKQLRLGGPPSMFPWLTVVGVAGDVRYGEVEAAPEPTIYQCLDQTRGPSLSVVVRSDGNPMGALGLIRSQIREVDR